MLLDVIWCFINIEHITAQKMKFFINNFFSECDQILLKKSLMENFILCAAFTAQYLAH